MANESTTTGVASPNFDKLKAKLRELFELDKADLDFGIYRILRQRHAEITEFLDKHLEKTVREALASHGGLQQAQVADDLRKAEQAAQAAGITPEQSPRVMELRAKLAAGTDLNALADEVYSHLLTFFARYYREGDFLGLHRSTVQGREKYMIPYNGEEVKLIWANMDQYYIKSSELLRDYTFHIRRADIAPGELPLGHLPEEVVVHFKLVEGDTEKDNRKPDGKTTRAFALDEEPTFVEDNDTTLTIHFRYREHPAERNLQEKLNAAPAEAREGYLISYFLDVESAGSASLLDLDQFRDPFSYQLKIATASAGETKETTIDLVETFNWLLGLKVKQIDTQKGFLTVTGEKRAGGRTLIIWRTLSDDAVKDNEALDKFLARLQINPADTEFDFIYVNGSHTLADPHNKVHLIEETFVRLMFEAHDFETLSES